MGRRHQLVAPTVLTGQGFPALQRATTKAGALQQTIKTSPDPLQWAEIVQRCCAQRTTGTHEDAVQHWATPHAGLMTCLRVCVWLGTRVRLLNAEQGIADDRFVGPGLPAWPGYRCFGLDQLREPGPCVLAGPGQGGIQDGLGLRPWPRRPASLLPLRHRAFPNTQMRREGTRTQA